MIRTYNLLKRKPSLYCPHRNVFVAVIRFSFFFFGALLPLTRLILIVVRVSVAESQHTYSSLILFHVIHKYTFHMILMLLVLLFLYIKPCIHMNWTLESPRSSSPNDDVCAREDHASERERDSLLYVVVILILFISLRICVISHFGIWTWLCSRCSSFVCCVYFYSHSPL